MLYFFLPIFPVSVDISPDLTCVVLRPRYYCIALIVELARKYLVLVSLQDLQYLARLRIPDLGYVIEPCR